MFGKKSKNNIHAILEYITNGALPEFREGRYYHAEALQRVFYIEGTEAEKVQKLVAAAFVELLNHISVKKWMQLDEKCRGSLYGYAAPFDMPMEWNKCEPDRKKYMHLSDNEYNAVLCMGTFHRNGYYREICLRYLSKTSGYLPYYIVRMNDWVYEVRETAYLLLCGKLKHCTVMELVEAMPMLERLLWSHRRSEQRYGELVELVRHRLCEDVSEQHLPEIVRQELLVRGSFYRLIAGEQILSRELMQGLLDAEPYGAHKERILLGIFRIYGCSEQAVDEYLSHKSSNVRYRALLEKSKLCPGVWDGMEKMLLDRARKIREYVIYVMTKYAEFDAGEFYRNELEASGNRVALEEMGYYGTKTDLPLIEGYLGSENPSVVRQALRAYGRVAGSDGSDLYWKYLCGKDLSLCREAYRIIVSNGIHYGADVLWAEYQRQKGLDVHWAEDQLQRGSDVLWMEYQRQRGSDAHWTEDQLQRSSDAHWAEDQLQRSSGTLWEKHQRQGETHCGEYIIYLLTYEPVWKRMRYMLELYREPDLPDGVRYRIERAIYERNAYAVISDDEAERLVEFLEENRKDYPERMVEGLLFDVKHAGRGE